MMYEIHTAALVCFSELLLTNECPDGYCPHQEIYSIAHLFKQPEKHLWLCFPNKLPVAVVYQE